MAGKDINIPITGDAREFIRETGDVEDALKDVSDALDDMARDTKRGGQDAERAVDKLADSFDDARKAAKDAGRAGEDAGDDIKRGMQRAEEGTEEFKDEANSTAREAAASFDGSAESIADMFQEVAANAFAGFGPAGAVAGLAAAAGIGLAVAGFQAADEARKESEERAAGWAQAYIDAGQEVIGATTVAAGLLAIATDPEQLKKAQENARNWGVDVSTAMRAISGDAAALQVVQGQVNEGQREYGNLSDKALAMLRSRNPEEAALVDQWKKGAAALAQQTGEMEQGAEAARNVSDGLKGLIDAAADATVQVDDLGNKVVTLPDSTQIFIDAQTGQASQNVDRFKGDLNSIPPTKAVTVNGTVDLSSVTTAINNYRPPKIRIEGAVYTKYGSPML